MERRYAVAVAVEAGERMQGANFAIEKSAVPAAPPRAADRPAAVNMEWGFDGQESGDARGDLEEVEAQPEAETDERRPRRRRRRGRRDDRSDQQDRVEPAGFATGESEIAAPDPHREEGTLDAGQDVSGDIPDRGEQPPAPVGEDDRDERRGRRRRRGRRGGRRDRDRDAGPQGEMLAESGNEGTESAVLENAGSEAGPVPAAEGYETSQGSETLGANAETFAGEARFERLEPQPRAAGGAAVEAVSEPHQELGGTETVAAQRHASIETEPIAYASPEPAQAPQTAPATDPEPPEPAHAEATVDDPSRPARKGWWQRRLSGG
jgi:ribonuclease E